MPLGSSARKQDAERFFTSVSVPGSPALALAIAICTHPLAVDDGLPAVLDVCHGRAPYECWRSIAAVSGALGSWGFPGGIGGLGKRSSLAT